jgi:hypothetical protein
MEFVRSALAQLAPNPRGPPGVVGALAEREERGVGIRRRADDLVGEKELTGIGVRCRPVGALWLRKSAETQ